MIEHLPAVSLDDRLGHLTARGDERLRRILAAEELAVRDARQALEDSRIQTVIALHASDDARGVGRRRVGILAAADADVHRGHQVAPAVDQGDDDVSPMEPGVDVVGIAGHAIDVIVVLPFDLVPDRQPVVRILSAPQEGVVDALVVLRLRRDAGQAGPDYLHHVVALEERVGVHARDEHAPVNAVAVVHDVAEKVAKPVGLLRQAGADDAEQISLHLEIDVVAVAVVRRGSRQRRHDALADVLAPVKVGVPQGIRSVGKHAPGLLGSHIQAIFLQGGQEGEFRVNVVLPQGCLHTLRLPFCQGRQDRPAVGLELVGLPVRHTHHLPCPGSRTLVRVDLPREPGGTRQPGAAGQPHRQARREQYLGETQRRIPTQPHRRLSFLRGPTRTIRRYPCKPTTSSSTRV